MDYHAPNKAIILDKFPIPIIKELLNELPRAHFFQSGFEGGISSNLHA